jgi:beta-glucanase (GH16 family)
MFASVTVLAALAAAAPSDGNAGRKVADEPVAHGWKLAWQDEFDGKAIDPAKWDFDVGDGFFNYDANVWIRGWGNDELEHYTKNPDNAFVRDGELHLCAIKESYQGSGYTSARMKTRKKDGSSLLAKRYGRFEIRAKLPTGQGIWPAIWLLPQDDKYGGWAASGEIDLMEARGQEPNKVLGTLHYGGRWPANEHKSNDYVLPDKGTIADFHVYALEWGPGELRWYVDGKQYAAQSGWWSSKKTKGNQGAKPENIGEVERWPAPFDQPFYLIMNVAVGGKFLGNPDKTTKFPAEMIVDYVRVYDSATGYGAPKPRDKGVLPFEQKK